MLGLVATLLLAQDAGVQRVVAAIAEAAKENHARPEKERATGDVLADLYIRRACATGQAVKPILLGLAYSLESTGIVAKNPLTRATFKDVESADGRKARLAAMGRPTLRGREDWLSHFVVSAALVALIGEEGAEAIGIQKEVTDAIGREESTGSGFSFRDLNADLAGIAFAKWLAGAESKRAVEQCSRTFAGADFVPDPEDLADGMSWSEFESTWGGVKDARFQAECKRLRARVQACKAHEAR